MYSGVVHGIIEWAGHFSNIRHSNASQMKCQRALANFSCSTDVQLISKLCLTKIWRHNNSLKYIQTCSFWDVAWYMDSKHTIIRIAGYICFTGIFCLSHCIIMQVGNYISALYLAFHGNCNMHQIMTQQRQNLTICAMNSSSG